MKLTLLVATLLAIAVGAPMAIAQTPSGPFPTSAETATSDELANLAAALGFFKLDEEKPSASEAEAAPAGTTTTTSGDVVAPSEPAPSDATDAPAVDALAVDALASTAQLSAAPATSSPSAPATSSAPAPISAPPATPSIVVSSVPASDSSTPNKSAFVTPASPNTSANASAIAPSAAPVTAPVTAPITPPSARTDFPSCSAVKSIPTVPHAQCAPTRGSVVGMPSFNRLNPFCYDQSVPAGGIMVCTATDGPKLAIIGHGPVAGQAEACAVSCASVGQAKCMEKKADVKECEAQTSMCVDFCKATLNVGRMLSLVPPTVAL